MRKLATVLAACSTMLIAIPASADHGGIHPSVRTERTYFTCVGSTKVQNLSMLAEGQTPGWDTTAPTQSVQQGAGCGTVDPLLTDPGSVNNGHDGAWIGTFAGNLTSMTVEAHMIDLGVSRTDDTFPLLITLMIDGDIWIQRTTVVDMTLVRSATNLTGMLRFSITDLGSWTNVYDAEGRIVDVLTEGLVTEDGDGTREREITLGLRAYADYPTAWVWDTTEVPAGITFNPAKLEAVKVAAVDPSS